MRPLPQRRQCSDDSAGRRGEGGVGRGEGSAHALVVDEGEGRGARGESGAEGNACGEQLSLARRRWVPGVWY